MKKWLALLAASALVFGLTACGGDDTSGGASTPATGGSSVAAPAGNSTPANDSSAATDDSSAATDDSSAATDDSSVAAGDDSTAAGDDSAAGDSKADGVYTAELDDASTEDGHGWRDTLILTYQDGKVVDVNFESYNADGLAKTQDEGYNMDPHPSEWIPTLIENAKNATTADEIDAVAGATGTSNSIKALYAAIEKDGKPGETIQVNTLS